MCKKEHSLKPHFEDLQDFVKRSNLRHFSTKCISKFHLKAFPSQLIIALQSRALLDTLGKKHKHTHLYKEL